VQSLTFNEGSTTRMTTTRQYDGLNRLAQIASTPTGTGVPPVVFAYQYNAANQRKRATLADGSFWAYEYDALGQVKSGKRFWSDWTPVAGQQFEYGFDDIGNRLSTKAGGDANGAGLRLASYGANLLNQYTNRTVPGTNDVLGVALATNAVSVNGQAAYRRGEYFWKEAGTNNASAPAWLGITVSSGTSNVTGHVLLARTPETFTHDADGNLTQDGRWDYTWDAENRLTAIERIASVPDASKARLDCQYNERSRRTQKIVSTWNGSNYEPAATNRFVYDGWNLIAILDSQFSILASFTWGLDLSGSLVCPRGLLHTGLDPRTGVFVRLDRQRVAGAGAICGHPRHHAPREKQNDETHK
jgi:YD repeat-containing protein